MKFTKQPFKSEQFDTFSVAHPTTSSSKTFSSPPKEAWPLWSSYSPLQPHTHPLSPRQPHICFLSLWNYLFWLFPINSFCSVAKSCLTLCNPMDCSTPGFLILHHLPEFACLDSRPLSRWYHPTISSSVAPFSSCLQSFPPSGSFPVSQFFASGGQITGASASTSVLLMNIQDWFPVGLTVWSPCCPRDSQESSPTTQFKSIQLISAH